MKILLLEGIHLFDFQGLMCWIFPPGMPDIFHDQSPVEDHPKLAFQ